MSLPADHPRLKKRPFSTGELLADGIVHAVALLAGVIAFAVLLGHVLGRGEVGTFAALAVYAAGYFAMFGFSLAYNMVPNSALKWVLRRFDHSAIYVMIAGTCYHGGRGAFGRIGALPRVLAGVVWAGAILGAVVKIALPGRYDSAFGAGLYRRAGWAWQGSSARWRRCRGFLAGFWRCGAYHLCGRVVLSLARAEAQCDLASVRGCGGGVAFRGCGCGRGG
ncbi:MAG: hemolysin III family protein [Paracoccaceae bacterium]